MVAMSKRRCGQSSAPHPQKQQQPEAGQGAATEQEERLRSQVALLSGVAAAGLMSQEQASAAAESLTSKAQATE